MSLVGTGLAIFKIVDTVKPFKKIRARRKAKREGREFDEQEFIAEEENEMPSFGREVIAGAVRHGLTAFGMVFVNSGLATESEATAAMGAFGVVVGFAWSVGRKWLRSRS